MSERTHREGDGVEFLDPGNEVHTAVGRRLLSARIAWLSTARADGSPHLVPVWFAWTGRTAVVFSGPAASKVRHLRAQPRCSLGLETEDRGNDVVLIDAQAELTGDHHPEVVAARDMFISKYGPSLTEGFDAWRQGFPQPVVLVPRRIVAWSKPDGALRYVAIASDG